MFFHHEKWGPLGKTDIYYELKVLDKTANDTVLKMSFNHVLIKIRKEGFKPMLTNSSDSWEQNWCSKENLAKVPSSGLWKLFNNLSQNSNKKYKAGQREIQFLPGARSGGNRELLAIG